MDDRERRRGLRRMKALATAALVVAALIYLATLHRDGGWAYLNAAAEAAMVGALADWFAVTALFRRPLGLPVPHTAIVPTRKDEIGEALQDFVATNFLSAEVVRGRLRELRPAERLGRWLDHPDHSRRVVDELARVGGGALTLLQDDRMAALLHDLVVDRAVRSSWGPPAGRVLGRVVADGAHHRLVDLTTRALDGWLVENEHVVLEIVAERAPSWTPQWIDERIGRRLLTEARKFVSDVAADPAHPARRSLDAGLARLAVRLREDPETMARADALRDAVLAHPDLGDALGRVWTSVRAALEEGIREEDGPLRERARAAVRRVGARVGEDDRVRGVLDRVLVDGVTSLVVAHRDEATAVISETVRRWDAAEATDRIETHVGRDLQFIRINGTVVGGLAGLGIHTLTVLLGG